MNCQLVLHIRRLWCSGELCLRVVEDGADDSGGNGRGVLEVNTGKQNFGWNISECGG